MNKIKSIDPMNDPAYSETDEISSGMLFAKVIKDIARYCTTYKSWIVYDGCVWQKDDQSVRINDLAISFTRALQHYVIDAVDKERTETQKKYEFYALGLGSRNKRLKMIEDAKSFNSIAWEDLDKDQDLFNCRNGTLNLRTLIFKEHDPADLLTKCANVIFDINAWSEEWEQFMCQIMQGDQDKIEYLQRISGYTLTAETSMEEMYICYGATTRNGKSTFLETIGYLMGDYSEVMNPESISEKKADASRASPDIVSLAGARFVRCNESPEKMLFNAALVKKMIGNDELKARALYESERKFQPVFKLWMNTNHLPIITDNTVFASNRIKVITFDRHFSDDEQDRHLKERLRTDTVISGIFNWMLEGLQNYRKHDTDPPECIRQASAAYAQMQDKIGNFISECLDPCEGNKMKMSDVYRVYQEWCKESGYGVESNQSFKKKLITKGVFKQHATIQGNTYTNIVINYRFNTDGNRLLEKSNRFR